VSFVLDTNVCIAFLKGEDAALRDRLLALDASDLFLCSVVKAELIYGARHSARVEANLAKLEAFFRPFESLPFDDRAAEIYGLVRSQLRRSGTPIGSNDLMIASIALAAEATLVSRNQAEFRRVVGLPLEEW